MVRPAFWLCFLLLVAATSCKQPEYFQFVDQSHPVSPANSIKEMNYASLNSTGSVSTEWSICSSMYIGFVRGRLTFFAVGQKNTSLPWFSLLLTLDNDKFKSYFRAKSKAYNFGYLTSSRSHDWSHACVSINSTSGGLVAFIDGQKMHDGSVEEVKEEKKIELHSRLILGATWLGVNQYFQSEGSVGNVNIYDGILSPTEMKKITQTGLFPSNPTIGWDTSHWTTHGNVTIRTSETKRTEKSRIHVFSKVRSWTGCVRFCPRLGRGSRLPSLGKRDVLERFKEVGATDAYIPAPFTDRDKEGQFVNIYDGTLLNPAFFGSGQPNGGNDENCVFWSFDQMNRTLYDQTCDNYDSIKFQCFCQFENNIFLKLRGLCPESSFDSKYTMKYEENEIAMKGLSGTTISLKNSEWEAVSVKGEQETRTRRIVATQDSYLLGRHDWVISSDANVCSKDKSTGASLANEYRIPLKMTSCNENEFTCWTGDCIRMEERCDNAFDCRDKSDESDCQLLVLDESYKSSVPPVISKLEESGYRSLIPVFVNVSLDLIDVLVIKERENEIQVRIRASLEWYEARAKFYNLKSETMMNTLLPEDVEKLWIPKIVYSNTKENENIKERLKEVSVTVKRESSYTVGGMNIVDETFIFDGKDNHLNLYLDYTNFFICKFQLLKFPFDTQVIDSLSPVCLEYQ